MKKKKKNLEENKSTSTSSPFPSLLSLFSSEQFNLHIEEEKSSVITEKEGREHSSITKKRKLLLLLNTITVFILIRIITVCGIYGEMGLHCFAQISSLQQGDPVIAFLAIYSGHFDVFSFALPIELLFPIDTAD